jgi:hypothetical protein
LESSIQLISRIFIHLRMLMSGRRIATKNRDRQIRFRRLTMLAELAELPTDTLFDMLYTVLAREFAITAADAAALEEIQRELQRRGGAPNWGFQTVN